MSTSFIWISSIYCEFYNPWRHYDAHIYHLLQNHKTMLTFTHIVYWWAASTRVNKQLLYT